MSHVKSLRMADSPLFSHLAGVKHNKWNQIQIKSKRKNSIKSDSNEQMKLMHAADSLSIIIIFCKLNLREKKREESDVFTYIHIYVHVHCEEVVCICEFYLSFI